MNQKDIFNVKLMIDTNHKEFSNDYTVIGKFFQEYQHDFIEDKNWRGILLSSDELAKGLKKQAPIKMNNSDNSLNLFVYFDTQKENHDDIKKFLSLIKYFRIGQTERVTVEGKKMGGYKFNIKEFIRALQIGTFQTIKKKDQKTQTFVLDTDETCCYLFE